MGSAETGKRYIKILRNVTTRCDNAQKCVCIGALFQTPIGGAYSPPPDLLVGLMEARGKDESPFEKVWLRAHCTIEDSV